MDFSTVASRERDALECGVRDTAFKSDAVGVALQSALGADNEAVDFTKIKLLDGQFSVRQPFLPAGTKTLPPI